MIVRMWAVNTASVHGGLRPALRRGRGVIPSISPGLHRGARHLPYAGDAGDPVRLLGGGRSLVTHRFDLHQPKGRPASRCRIFSTRSALSVARSATTLFKRRVSSSSMGVSRCFKRASRPRGTRHATARVSRPSPRGVD